MTFFILVRPVRSLIGNTESIIRYLLQLLHWQPQRVQSVALPTLVLAVGYILSMHVMSSSCMHPFIQR